MSQAEDDNENEVKISESKFLLFWNNFLKFMKRIFLLEKSKDRTRIAIFGVCLIFTALLALATASFKISTTCYSMEYINFNYSSLVNSTLKESNVKIDQGECIIGIVQAFVGLLLIIQYFFLVSFYGKFPLLFEVEVGVFLLVVGALVVFMHFYGLGVFFGAGVAMLMNIPIIVLILSESLINIILILVMFFICWIVSPFKDLFLVDRTVFGERMSDDSTASGKLFYITNVITTYSCVFVPFTLILCILVVKRVSEFRNLRFIRTVSEGIRDLSFKNPIFKNLINKDISLLSEQDKIFKSIVVNIKNYKKHLPSEFRVKEKNLKSDFKDISDEDGASHPKLTTKDNLEFIKGLIPTDLAADSSKEAKLKRKKLKRRLKRKAKRQLKNKLEKMEKGEIYYSDEDDADDGKEDEDEENGEDDDSDDSDDSISDEEDNNNFENNDENNKIEKKKGEEFKKPKITRQSTTTSLEIKSKSSSISNNNSNNSNNSKNSKNSNNNSQHSSHHSNKKKDEERLKIFNSSEVESVYSNNTSSYSPYSQLKKKRKEELEANMNRKAAIGMNSGLKERRVTFLICDIIGFHSLFNKKFSKNNSFKINNSLIEMMYKIHRDYVTAMVPIIEKKFKGRVDSFSGDKIIASWNATDKITMEANSMACSCALEMMDVMKTVLNEKWRKNKILKKNQKNIECKICITCGMMLTGYIGSSSMMRFAHIGEKVTQAFRMLRLADTAYHLIKDNIIILKDSFKKNIENCEKDQEEKEEVVEEEEEEEEEEDDDEDEINHTHVILIDENVRRDAKYKFITTIFDFVGLENDPNKIDEQQRKIREKEEKERKHNPLFFTINSNSDLSHLNYFDLDSHDTPFSSQIFLLLPKTKRQSIKLESDYKNIQNKQSFINSSNNNILNKSNQDEWYNEINDHINVSDKDKLKSVSGLYEKCFVDILSFDIDSAREHFNKLVTIADKKMNWNRINNSNNSKNQSLSGSMNVESNEIVILENKNEKNEILAHSLTNSITSNNDCPTPPQFDPTLTDEDKFLIRNDFFNLPLRISTGNLAPTVI